MADNALPEKPAVFARGATSKTLARRIFRGELSAQEINELPAQSLYMAAKQAGLASTADLIKDLSKEQRAIFLDLDLWRIDRFHEDNIWEWLSLPDQGNDLTLLKKLLQAIDLKLVALFLGRYVTTEVVEEATDHPPGPNFYTPDKGRTWVMIETEDSSKHFLLSRLLAFIFEDDPGLFYNLLSLAQTISPSALEEESYQERKRRLQGEAIPDDELAYEVNTPLSEQSALQEIKSKTKHTVAIKIPVVEPLIYDSLTLNPLGSLLAEAANRDELEAEITMLLNSAIVRWSVDFCEQSDVLQIAQKVKGALNIGLEICLHSCSESALTVYEVLGLQKIYRVALGKLFDLRKSAAVKVSGPAKTMVATDPLLEILTATSQPFPEMPAFLRPDGSYLEEAGVLLPGRKAIEKNEELMRLFSIVGTPLGVC